MKSLFSITAENLTNKKIVDWSYTEELSARTYGQFEKWIEKGKHGPLNYLTDARKSKRENLKFFYPEAKSALVFLFQYTDAKKELNSKNLISKIASYTLGFDGEDYHFWIKKQLEDIGTNLQAMFTGLEFKLTLDIHPVLERDLAQRSGLGWFGKNSMLISKEHGSFVLIGSLILNQSLVVPPNEIETDHCGNCTRCIDACPTNAIIPGEYTIDTSKCISTHTIELFKEAIPPKGYPTLTKEIFGCDICQDVCPWNNKPLEKSPGENIDSKLVDFFNRDINTIYSSLESMSNNEYKQFFYGTSFYRSGKRGLLKNLKPYLTV